jgi:hypothetical protein
MFVVVTKENKLIRNFEDGKITGYEDKRQAEMLAQIVDGKVERVDDETFERITNK